MGALWLTHEPTCSAGACFCACAGCRLRRGIVGNVRRQLKSLEPFGRLRIYCAGVWHNAVMAVGAGVALLCLPVMLSPCYTHSKGPSIISTKFLHPVAFRQGDVLVHFDVGCRVETRADWHQCIHSLQDEFDAGFTGTCVPRAKLGSLLAVSELAPDEEGLVQCCPALDPGAAAGPSTLCFVEAPAVAPAAAPVAGCGVVRTVLGTATARCRDTGDCGAGGVCLRHSLDAADSRLLQIGKDSADSVLYLGSLHELAGSIALSDYTARASVLPASLPYHLTMFLNYLLSMSAAFAVLNIVPAFHFDGEGAFHAAMDALFERTERQSAAKLLCSSLCVLLLLLNFAVILIRLVLVATFRW